MSSETADTAKNPLNAALKIVSELTGMTPEQQSLAVRFAIETLGLKITALRPDASATPPGQPAAPALAETGHPRSGSAHATDIKTFTAMKAPKTDQQFTAVVAYFYQFEAKPEERKETIDAETMKDAARLAGRPQVERWNMTLTNAKNAGYLDTTGAGKYKLSSVGENLVAITLPDSAGNGKTRTSGTVRKPKKATQKKAIKKKK